MYRRCLIAVFLTICLFGCNPPTPEERAQDPNITPEGVRITPDVIYGHKFGMALTFDLYQPQNQNGAGVIFINSGGWQSPIGIFHKQTTGGLRLYTVEDLETTKWVTITGEIMTVNMRCFNIEKILSKGFTVFNVRHGSSPKFQMNEIVADLRRAVRFIRYHAGEYGVDAERLGLWGGSAGGHLSLLLGTTGDIGNTEASEEFEKGTGRVAAVVAFFPPTDLVGFLAYLKENSPEILKIAPAVDLNADELKAFSPIYFVTSDDSPALIIHGDKDPGVPINQGKSMYEALQEAGVESRFITIPGAEHGFFDKDADQAVDEVISWFEEHLVEK